MVITDEFKKKLRKYLHEVIPPDGTAADTNLSDEDIEELLADADNIYSAAAQGWRLKATISPMEPGQITKYSIGQETYERSTASDYLSYCMQMAQMYDEMAQKLDNCSGSFFLNVRRPKVL